MKILTSNNYEIISTNTRTNVRFYTSLDPGSYVAPHWHDAVEIVLLEEGELFYSVEDQEQKVIPGSCILTNPNVIHSTYCTHPNKAIVFQIPVAFLEKYIPEARSLVFSFNDKNTNDILQTKVDIFKETLKKMQVMMDTKPKGGVLRFNSLLFEAVFQLYHNFSTADDEAAVKKRSQRFEKLKGVLDYIDEHYNESISLQEISSIAMFEPKYFCRFFKSTMDSTFLEYQNKIRLSKIYNDLLETDDKVSDILERHGFSNYKLFRKMFHEQFGMTPTEIRARRKQG